MDDLCEVVITAPDADWLADFTRQLIEMRLCAGGHNIAVIRSIYRWQGGIHDRPEAHVTLHTRRDLVARIVEQADQLHPYEVPCVVALPMIDGNPAYAQWIRDETVPPG